MNVTNKDYFTFNVDNSMLLCGQTGTGKSVLQDKHIDEMVKAHDPATLQFVLFDMTQCDFWDLREKHKEYVMKYVTDMASDKPFELLDEMADLSEKRIMESVTKPLIFILIEECNMAATDQKRFDKAVITINKNAKRANMKLVYSTSRPAPDVVSKELIASFDLILTGQLASEADAEHLGVPYRSKSEPYSFLVTQHSDIYNAEGDHHEMMDISKLDINFGGDNEPHDDQLSELLKKAYSGELNCYRAVIPIDMVAPYSDFQPTISEGYATYFQEMYQTNTPPDLLVYEKDGKFMMCDDYNAYFMYRNVGASTAICTVIGEPTSTAGIDFGPPFKLQLPSLEVRE